MIVNKPRGMITHHGAGATEGTLQDLLERNDLDRNGIVHRLDKNTAGLLIVAKTAEAQLKLQECLRNREIKRTYTGIVEGVVHDHGTINKNLIRSPRNRTKYITTKDGGREAVTHYWVERQFKKHTLLKFQLETGRTHQIRVHCKSIGHPLVGDSEYNPKSSIKIDGQMLESIALEFIHPITQKEISINIKSTPIFVDVLNKLG